MRGPVWITRTGVSCCDASRRVALIRPDPTWVSTLLTARCGLKALQPTLSVFLADRSTARAKLVAPAEADMVTRRRDESDAKVLECRGGSTLSRNSRRRMEARPATARHSINRDIQLNHMTMPCTKELSRSECQLDTSQSQRSRNSTVS